MLGFCSAMWSPISSEPKPAVMCTAAPKRQRRPGGPRVARGRAPSFLQALLEQSQDARLTVRLGHETQGNKHAQVADEYDEFEPPHQAALRAPNTRSHSRQKNGPILGASSSFWTSSADSPRSHR